MFLFVVIRFCLRFALMRLCRFNNPQPDASLSGIGLYRFP